MANDPLIASRTPTALPDPNSGRKLQKGYQLDETYNPQQVNQEFDRVYEALNKIAVAAANLADLDSSTATAAQCATRLNAFGAILRQSGLMKPS